MIEVDVDPWQLEVIRSPARVKLLMAGRGAGKTVGVARPTIIRDGLETIDGEFAYFSPSYAIAKRECKTIGKNRQLAPFIERVEDQPFPRIVWQTGTSTYFRSLDREENVLGYHLNGAIVDEVHKVGERLIHEVIRPQLGAKRGYLLMMGQHDEDGEDGWIYKQFYLPGIDPARPEFAAWRVPSSMGRQYLGPEGEKELEMIRASTSDYVWRWQYMAEAIETANKAFRPDDIRGCTSGDTRDDNGGMSCTIGYDLGKVLDPSAQVVLAKVSENKSAVLNAELQKLGVPHDVQALGVQRLAKRYGDPVVLVDVTGGGAGATKAGQDQDVYVKFYRDTVPTMRGFYLNQHSKAQIIQALQLAIEQKRISIPATCKDLLRQLGSYRWERRPSGGVDYHGPNGHDDDLVIALALALYAMNRGWTSDTGRKSLDVLM